MIATSAGNVVKLWKDDSLRTCMKTEKSAKNVQCLAWCGQKLGYLLDESVHFLNHQEEPHIFEKLGSKVVSAEFSTTNNHLVALGLYNGVAMLYDIKRGKLHKKFSDSSQSPVMKVILMPKETRVIAGHQDGSVVLTSLMTQQTFAPLEKRTDSDLVDLQRIPWRSGFLVGLFASGVIHQWDLFSPNRTIISEISGLHKGPPSALALSPINDRTALSVGLDKNIEFLDLKDNKLVKTIPTAHPLTSISFLNNGTSVIVGSTKGSLYTYDLRKLLVPLVEVQDAHHGPVSNISVYMTEMKPTRNATAHGTAKKARNELPRTRSEAPKEEKTPPPANKEKENIAPIAPEKPESPSGKILEESGGSQKSAETKHLFGGNLSVVSNNSDVFSPLRNEMNHSHVIKGLRGSLSRLSSGSPVFSPVQIASSPMSSITPSRVLNVFNTSDVVSPTFGNAPRRRGSATENSYKIPPIAEEPVEEPSGKEVEQSSMPELLEGVKDEVTDEHLAMAFSDVFKSCSRDGEDLTGSDFPYGDAKSDVTPLAPPLFSSNEHNGGFPSGLTADYLANMMEKAVRNVVRVDLSDTRGNVKDLVSEFGYILLKQQLQLKELVLEQSKEIEELRREMRNMRKFY
ncbi:protein NEDD1-like [Artemia franciscana]|uniref:Uncharacterized protein n=1 Tax=Artemia franciscana TaxID=6661 RepID=A0AA88H934_ARTSF|nr:hypothetical protein QYM36_016051 [Artemia franciscana]